MARAGLEPAWRALSPTTSIRAKARPTPPIGEATASRRRRRVAYGARPAGRSRSRLGVLSLPGPVAGRRRRGARRRAIGRLLGLRAVIEALKADGRAPKTDRARKRRRDADLQGRGGFRRDRRGAPGSRLPVRRADDRRRAVPAAVTAAGFFVAVRSDRRGPAPPRRPGPPGRHASSALKRVAAALPAPLAADWIWWRLPEAAARQRPPCRLPRGRASALARRRAYGGLRRGAFAGLRRDVALAGRAAHAVSAPFFAAPGPTARAASRSRPRRASTVSPAACARRAADRAASS